MTGAARADVHANIPMTSPYLDDPGRRLLWALPLAVLIWLALLIGFSRMLEETAPPPAELKAVEARIVEVPPEVGGLQGGPAPATPAPTKPHPEVVKTAPVVHPRVETRPHLKVKTAAPPIAPVAPSATGAAKSTEPPAESSSTTPTNSDSGGVAGGTGSGNSAGLGSDTAGARALYAPIPKIPDELRADDIDMVATAHFSVSYDGRVEVSLVKPTTSPELNRTLLDALKEWRFSPAVKNGVAVNSEFDLRIPIRVQ
jgi:protein TonB